MADAWHRFGIFGTLAFCLRPVVAGRATLDAVIAVVVAI